MRAHFKTDRNESGSLTPPRRRGAASHTDGSGKTTHGLYRAAAYSKERIPLIKAPFLHRKRSRCVPGRSCTVHSWIAPSQFVVPPSTRISPGPAPRMPPESPNWFFALKGPEPPFLAYRELAPMDATVSAAGAGGVGTVEVSGSGTSFRTSSSSLNRSPN